MELFYLLLSSIDMYEARTPLSIKTFEIKVRIIL